VWQLRGRYPNRGYPKIFNDPTVGPEAKKLFEEAQQMLSEFVQQKRVTLNGIVGFYPANSVGDDIEVRPAAKHTHLHLQPLCQHTMSHLVSALALQLYDTQEHRWLCRQSPHCSTLLSRQQD